MKNFLKHVFLYTLALVISVTLFTSVAEQAHAAQLQGLRVSLSDSTAGQSAVHTFTFTHPTANTLRQISFDYCTNPSGTCTGPAGFVGTGATESTITGISAAEWSITGSVDEFRAIHVGTGQAVGGNTVIVVGASGLTNHDIDDCQAGGDASSDTCYVSVTSYTGLGTGAVDNGVTSITVVEPVVVTARVDPTFTFVISAVGANTVSNAITSSVATTYSTIPFGNLTASTPKYAAQRLQVITNTTSGYTVSQRLTTDLTGVYASNNIDPFIASWGTPTTWTEPTGTTPNVNTGWIGANTNDADVTQFVGTALFGPVSSSANNVMTSTTSDNGSTTVIVMYGIEANVFQAADTYTGTLIYNALPIY